MLHNVQRVEALPVIRHGPMEDRPVKARTGSALKGKRVRAFAKISTEYPEQKTISKYFYGFIRQKNATPERRRKRRRRRRISRTTASTTTRKNTTAIE